MFHATEHAHSFLPPRQKECDRARQTFLFGTDSSQARYRYSWYIIQGSIALRNNYRYVLHIYISVISFYIGCLPVCIAHCMYILCAFQTVYININLNLPCWSMFYFSYVIAIILIHKVFRSSYLPFKLNSKRIIFNINIKVFCS